MNYNGKKTGYFTNSKIIVHVHVSWNYAYGKSLSRDRLKNYLNLEFKRFNFVQLTVSLWFAKFAQCTKYFY